MPETDNAAHPARDAILRVFAPAKINLTLHITDQRRDGYHLIDSFVAFADVGDNLTAQRKNTGVLQVMGPEAATVPVDASNLILKVAALFDGGPDVSFSLTKNLPVASGIGGGSADAAAACRALTTMRMTPTSPETLKTDLLRLGADIPMCLASSAARVGGIGEDLESLDAFPVVPAVLINPRCAMSTPAVFKALENRTNPPMPGRLPTFRNVFDLASWLSTQRNDMEATATGLEPAIAAVKSALATQNGCLLARMSGSGATCFGLFPNEASATSAATKISGMHPNWWIKATALGSQAVRAHPQIR